MTSSNIPQNGPTSSQAVPITLEQIHRIPLNQVAGLDVGVLKRLLEEAEQHLAQAKRIKSFLEGALDHRFGVPLLQLRQEEEKPTGTIRMQEGEYTIISNIPKKPVWNQEKLAAIAEEIRRDGVDPANYLGMEYTVAERRFTAWPPHIQQVFMVARTLKTGKPTYKIERTKKNGGM